MYYTLVTYYIHYPNNEILIRQYVICSKEKFTLSKLRQDDIARKITGVTTPSVHPDFSLVADIPSHLDTVDAFNID